MATAFEAGHFYSPIVNPDELILAEKEIWNNDSDIPGIDFNDRYHELVLKDYFPRHIQEYDFPETSDETDSATDFYTQNSQFSWLDSRVLFVLLKEWKPGQMIEVGSGFSSLLTAKVNAEHLNGSINFKCIEPYPRDFLKEEVSGIQEVIVEKVQQVPLSEYERLDSGDILFIDSSHVAKTGSDVNHLVFHVLPVLKKGVRIHFHDIFLPLEYPKDWVLRDNRSWNEQYLLRALLMYSSAFKVLFGCSYANYKYPDLVVNALNLPDRHGFGGGSLWIEKVQ